MNKSSLSGPGASASVFLVLTTFRKSQVTSCSMNSLVLQPDNDDCTEAASCASGFLITAAVVHVYKKVPALLLTRSRRLRRFVT